MLINRIVTKEEPFVPNNLPNNPLKIDPNKDKNITKRYIYTIIIIILFYFILLIILKNRRDKKAVFWFSAGYFNKNRTNNLGDLGDLHP